MVLEELRKIGREALFNAFHHAQAKKIEVELHFGLFELRLRFRDNGLGMDAAVFAKAAYRIIMGCRNERAGPGNRRPPRVMESTGEMDQIQVRIPGRLLYRREKAMNQGWVFANCSAAR